MFCPTFVHTRGFRGLCWWPKDDAFFSDRCNTNSEKAHLNSEWDSTPILHISYGGYCRRREGFFLRYLRISGLRFVVLFEYTLCVIFLWQILFTRQDLRVKEYLRKNLDLKYLSSEEIRKSYSIKIKLYFKINTVLFWQFLPYFWKKLK